MKLIRNQYRLDGDCITTGLDSKGAHAFILLKTVRWGGMELVPRTAVTKQIPLNDTFLLQVNFMVLKGKGEIADIKDKLYSAFADISDFENVHITYGPEHKDYPQSEWKTELEKYFETYSHLCLDLYYYCFLHLCVQYSIDDLNDEDFYYHKNYFCLHFAPLSDEGFALCTDDGYFIFCDGISRFSDYDESNESNDTAEYLFALKIKNDRYMGIFCKVIIEIGKSEMDWKYYCDNFYSWLLALRERRGNFLRLDEKGVPA